MEVGVNGTWLDNCSIGIYSDYDPALGKVDYQFETKVRRDMMKRLSAIAWQMMRPPVWLSNPKTLPASVNNHIERSKWGICLLHDVHNNLPERMVRELNYFIDYQTASRSPFRGYWDITPALG